MPKVTVDQIIEAVQDDDGSGFCLACGEQHWNVEPDARKYECGSCGKNEVYGAEECLLMVSFPAGTLILPRGYKWGSEGGSA